MEANLVLVQPYFFACGGVVADDQFFLVALLLRHDVSVDDEVATLAAAIHDDLARALALRLEGKGDADVYRVHGRFGEPCPRCGNILRRVDFEEHTITYCPTCQTGGRVLKDRRLSRLLRGQRGTEGAVGTPAPAGARVVVLDEALAPLPIPEAALGLEANWRFGPASKPVADRSYRQLGFTPEGVGLRPLSVGHVRQPWRTARAPGDLVIAWTRRSRALAADSWTATEVPLGEEREAYEVEILDGSAVMRTLATSTTNVTYSAAQQLADLGALLGPGDILPIRILHLSALVGRGAPASLTLEF